MSKQHDMLIPCSRSCAGLNLEKKLLHPLTMPGSPVTQEAMGPCLPASHLSLGLLSVVDHMQNGKKQQHTSLRQSNRPSCSDIWGSCTLNYALLASSR